MSEKGYMCSTDFDAELGMKTTNAAKVYASLEALQVDKHCVRPAEEKGHRLHCGIYEVEIKIVRVVKEPNF